MSDAPPPPPPPPSGPAYHDQTVEGLATWAQRFVAVIIDSVIVGAVATVIGAVLGADFGGPLASLINLVLGVAYYSYLHANPRGQTVGKRVMNIRVVRTDGAMMELPQSVGRYFANFLSAIPCLLGYFWPLWDDKNQTFHDKIVNTYVVKA